MQSMHPDTQIQIFRKKLTRVLNKVKEKIVRKQANVLAVLYLISLLVSDQSGHRIGVTSDIGVGREVRQKKI